MKRRNNLAILFLALCLVLWSAQIGEAGPMGTAFTYQGRLIDANYPADGEYDFQFKLYDANSDGNQVDSDVNKPDVDVIDGYFTCLMVMSAGWRLVSDLATRMTQTYTPL
jgi:hypothetical protein